MRRFLKILGWAAGIVVVVLVGAVTYAMNADLNSWKPEIQDLVRDKTGRLLVIGGPIEFDLGTDTSLKATNITLSNADWGSRPSMVEVGSVDVGLKLFSLLGDAPDVTRLHVKDVRVIVETNEAGQANTQFGPMEDGGQADHGGGGGGGPAIPVLRDVRVSNVEIAMKTPEREDLFMLHDLSLGGGAPSDPVKVNLEAAYNDLAFVMGGELGSPQSMTSSSAPTAIDLSGNLAGFDVAIGGQIQDLAGQDGFDVTVSVDSAEIGHLVPAVLGTAAGGDVPSIGPLSVSMALRGGMDDGLSLADLNAKVGREDRILLTAVGGIGDLMRQSGIDLIIGATSPELGSLSDLAEQISGQTVPNIGPLALSAKIAGDMSSQLSLSELDVNLGRAETVLIKAGGGISDVVNASGADLSFEVVSPDLSALSGLVGSPVPPIGPVDISGSAKGANGEPIVIDPFVAKVGGSDVSGTATIDMTGAVPSIVARLASERFDLADVSKSAEGGGGGQSGAAGGGSSAGSGDGRVIPADPLPLDGMKAVNATIEYTAQTFVAAVAELTDLEVTVSLDNGKLAVSPLKAGVGAGSLTGAISLDGSQAVAPLSVNIQGAAMDLDALLAGAGFKDKIVGPMDLTIDLAGAGESPRAIAASLNGKLASSVYGTKVLKKAVEEAAGETLAGMLSEEGGWIVVDCAVFDYDISNGLMQTKAGYTASGPVTVITEDTINLGTEELDLTVTPSGGILSVTLGVTGTFANPSFGPKVGAEDVALGALALLTGGASEMLIGAASIVAGLPDGHPCKQAVADSQAQAESQGQSGASPAGASPAGAASEAVESVGDAIEEGVGGALKGLFGGD